MKIQDSKLFLIFFPMLVSLTAYTQHRVIDSLKKVLLAEREDTNKVNILIDISYSCLDQNDYVKGIEYADQAIALANKTGYKKGKAHAYICLYYNRGYSNKNNSEIFVNLFAALKLYEEIGYKKGIAQCYHLIGGEYRAQGDDSLSLRNSFIALKINRDIGDTISMALNYINIGNVYLNQRNYPSALQYFYRALNIFQTIDYSTPGWGTAWCYNSIGQTYEREGDSVLASGDKKTASVKFSDALKNYLLASEIQEKVKRKDNISESYFHIGNLYIKRKELVKARNYLEKSLKLSKEIGARDLAAEGYYKLSDLESLQSNFKQAYEHFKKYILYRDSLEKDESSKRFLQTQMQYEYEKKEVIAKAEQNKKDAEARRIKSLQYYTIASLVIVVLAVIIIAVIQWRSNKQKQKANFLLTEQKHKVESTLAELKTTQAQLIQSEKMASLGELTAGIAHEIQNPLNFVNNFSEVSIELADELKEEINHGNKEEANAIADDIKENLEKVVDHGRRADTIVKGMLQHSRASTGKKELTDINALADEYLRLAYHGLRAKDKSFNATIETHFEESICKIEVVPQDIGRVLLNLFNNAFYAVTVKKKTATSKGENYGPIVSVSTKREGDKVIILVRDNGIGISQKALDKIFQPFFTTKPTGQGTGLGLSLSYDIVKAHGGELKVETKEGEYAEFIVQLLAFQNKYKY